MPKILSKEQWLKEIEEWQETIKEILGRYMKLYSSEKDLYKKSIYMLMIEECKKALHHNEILKVRAEVEADYLLFMKDEKGDLVLKRLLPRERKELEDKLRHYE
ncbi:MAG: hypothetical protein ACTSVW_00405 [Candidatus Njordarchaeales archaeon]